MAKVQNMWLKNVVGKVGDSTLYVSGGETIMRNGTSNVKNPQSYAQMIQRVIAKTAMNNYSALQFLANHSFQGKPTGSKCMERFLSRNMRYLRDRAAEIVNAGGSLYEFYQFAAVGSVKFVPAAVILAEGKLPLLVYGVKADGSAAHLVVPGRSTPITYADIINAYNLKRGDQLTFVSIDKNTLTGEYIPHYVRVILDPRNADGTAASLDSTFIGSGANIGKPNMRNRGGFISLGVAGDNLEYKLSNGLVAAAGVIVSRKMKGAWMRSNCKLVINEGIIGTDLMSLGSAVDKSLSGSEIYTDDDLYLNNAGSGGEQGTDHNLQPSTAPVVNNNVSINGISQDVSGGSVSTDNLTNIVVTGSNLTSELLTIRQSGQSEVGHFTASEDGRSATYDAGGTIIPNEDRVYTIFVNGQVWFNLTVRGTIQGIE